MEILNKIFEFESNAEVLSLLDLKKEDISYFKMGKDAGSSFDSGGKIFLNDYAELLPDDTKLTLNIFNVLVNPQSGEIFAFQWGSFTFLLKCDFSRIEISKSISRLKTTTMDGEVDFTTLGDSWVILNADFEGDEKQHFLHAYNLTK